MTVQSLSKILPLVQTHGRTVADEEKQALFFNWTCAGFSVRFTGTTLKATFCAIGEAPLGPAPGTKGDGPRELPFVAVVGDDGQTILQRIECVEPAAQYVLWQAQEAGEHTLRIVKLSENARGKVGLTALETDGELLPICEAAPKLYMEFVGDSITCGYGNEAQNKDDPFLPSEENGWAGYAALAARALGAEFSCVSVSGISAGKSLSGFPPFDAMETLYEYTDAIYDKKCGKTLQPWNFAEHRNDVVVLNLGTNDVNPVRFAADLPAAMREEEHFCSRYKAFLQMLRRCNGPATWICCTLGPMDYYLYDDIQKTVSAYKAETGDERICCFKFVGVNLMTESFGAVGHPSLKTHARMALELTTRLREAGIVSENA